MNGWNNSRPVYKYHIFYAEDLRTYSNNSVINADKHNAHFFLYLFNN